MTPQKLLHGATEGRSLLGSLAGISCTLQRHTQQEVPLLEAAQGIVSEVKGWRPTQAGHNEKSSAEGHLGRKQKRGKKGKPQSQLQLMQAQIQAQKAS